MIDAQGYRLNIGIVLANADGKLFWGRRSSGGKEGWQFPQGGMCAYETLEEAMYRELAEETGLSTSDVRVLKITSRWLYYQIPPNSRHKPVIDSHGNIKKCIGQRQRWFLLQLLTDSKQIRFDTTDHPEFVDWRWVDYWYPLQHIVSFKQKVYAQVLREFEPLLFSTNSAE